MLEDRLRAHPLVSQCLVVGDGKPFIGALITIDADALPGWRERNGKPAGDGAADLVDDPELRAEIGAAVADANQAVSRAEQIREFRILANGLQRGQRRADPDDEDQATRWWRRTTPTRSPPSTPGSPSPPSCRPGLGGARDLAYRVRSRRPAHGGAPASSARSWPTRAGQVQSARIHRRPAAPMARARSGSASKPAHRAHQRIQVAAAHHVPGDPVADGLRRPARVTDHHGQPARRRLQGHDAQALHVQSAGVGAAGQREHVAHRVVGGQLRSRHPPGEQHRVGHPAAGGQPAQPTGRPDLRRPAAIASPAPWSGSAAGPGSARPAPCAAPAGTRSRSPGPRRGGTGGAARPGPTGRVGTPRCPRRSAAPPARPAGRTPRPPGRGCSGRSW